MKERSRTLQTSCDANDSSLNPSEGKLVRSMVQVRRHPKELGFLNEVTFNRHILHVMLFLVILLCWCSYRILLNQEEKMLQTGSIRTGVAAAHSAFSLMKKPRIVYGTAWKKEDTAKYVAQAVKSGFRFIDTACQPKHYNEPGVGNGWTAAATEMGLQRSDIWLQTKFTPFPGQDPDNCPYDPDDPIEVQVQTSLRTSLKNLHTEYLDSWVMHSPYDTLEETLVAWRTMEAAVDEGLVKELGMSNCYSLEFFKGLYEHARHKPKVLQNRFYSTSKFDTELRQFCKENGISYQSFWTLGANRKALQHPEVKEGAKMFHLTPETYMFAFLMSLGYIHPLSGTTSLEHMAQDVAVMERIQGGEVFFPDDIDLRKFARILGMPDL